jgi:hypothetical protein
MKLLFTRSILPMLCVFFGAFLASASVMPNDDPAPNPIRDGITVGLQCIDNNTNQDYGACTQCCHTMLRERDNPESALQCWYTCIAG